MDEFPKDLGGAIGTIGTGIVLGALWLRSKLSRDNVQRANDGAEINMLSAYQKENGELRASLAEVTIERNKLYRDIGEMAGSIRALEERHKMLEETIGHLRQEVAMFRGTANQGGAIV